MPEIKNKYAIRELEVIISRLRELMFNTKDHDDVMLPIEIAVAISELETAQKRLLKPR